MFQVILFSGVLIFTANGCTVLERSREGGQPVVPIEYVSVPENPVPGTVTRPYIEPMVNIIRVPGAIDPSDTYYLAPHEAVVEIYPGRYQEVQYPGDYGRTEEKK